MLNEREMLSAEVERIKAKLDQTIEKAEAYRREIDARRSVDPAFAARKQFGVSQLGDGDHWLVVVVESERAEPYRLALEDYSDERVFISATSAVLAAGRELETAGTFAVPAITELGAPCITLAGPREAALLCALFGYRLSVGGLEFVAR